MHATTWFLQDIKIEKVFYGQVGGGGEEGADILSNVF